MAERIPADEQANYETFRDCLSEPVLKALAAPVVQQKARNKRHARRVSKKGGRSSGVEEREGSAVQEDSAQPSDAEDLGEFIDYLSSLIFPSLPLSLRTLSHTTFKSSPALQSAYTPPLSHSTRSNLLLTIPPPALDMLTSAALLPPQPDPPALHALLTPVLTAYITAVTAAPPPWSQTRTSACELCARSWVPLTYHHLIPKSTHERVRRRGWHGEEALGSVAWLCRACHSFVHRLRGNEELARGFYTVELIVGGGVEGDDEVRERVEGWVKWVGGVRWGSR